MKRGILLLLTILAIGCQAIYAQTDGYINPDTGRVWNSQSANLMDSAITHQIQSSQLQQATFNQMMMGDMARNMMKENFGNEKIAAGKATTRITLSPRGSYVEKWATNSKSPQEQQQTRAIGNLCLQTFSSILKSKNLTPYDVTDSQALAFVMSYLVYFDKDPGDSRLQKIRQSFRQSNLKDAVLQGTPEYEKQQDYESLAIRTMLGVRAYELSKRQNLSERERSEASKSAREYAGSILKSFWDGTTIDSIELIKTGNGFGDKGERLATSGKGTTAFKRSEQSVWANKNAICYDADNFTRSGDHSCFYEMRKRFDVEVTKLGGATNDAAYANAVAFKIIYPIYADGVQLNAKQFNWVLNEMRKDVTTSTDFQSSSDEGKQAYYDSLSYYSVRIYDDYQKAKKSLTDSKSQNGYSGKVNGNVASERIEKQKGYALERLQDIFQPRKIEDYELRPDGFVKIR